MVASGPNGGRGTGVEMVTFSAFLARCGVGGGRRPRAPTGTTGILPVGGEGGVLPFQRAGRPLSQWCAATGETPVVPVMPLGNPQGDCHWPRAGQAAGTGPNGGEGAGFEMMTFSAVLARCGVGGGTRPRAPTGTTGILPVGGEGGVLPFQRAGRPLSQWCAATGETPVVPVMPLGNPQGDCHWPRAGRAAGTGSNGGRSA